LGPKESIRIQEKLGADIIFAFDECTSPMASEEYTKASLKKTHEWAKICLKAKRTKQALYGIVQGGKFPDLRKESARFIGSLPFDGFGIGGEFGDDKKTMINMLKLTLKELPEEKPRHLLGIGYLEDIPKIIKAGVDTFDCIVPTHYARRGMAYTSSGELDLNKDILKNDKKVLDPKCGCPVCQKYSRGYIHHLLRAREMTGMSLLTLHNLYFFNNFVERIRNDIKKGLI
jgi:queuine tRNA-ribosyltransferase/7-cyano-7-deazaguanine tRNA-ribosyltransferase